jgi:hypothetical protein
MADSSDEAPVPARISGEPTNTAPAQIALRIALFVSMAMLALRVDVAGIAGFGDAEALYASYALHPQPAYLDHPGLIGAIARLIGRGSSPEPHIAHMVTAALATLLAWLGGLSAWAAGASWRGAMATVLTLSLVPELGIGLFGLTPHLPLAICWIGALGLTALALRSEPSSVRALVALLGAGILVGGACLSHLSGALLGLALLAALIGRGQLARWKTAGPWAAIGVALVLIVPVLIWEAREGWPMLRHRLVETQAHAGLSLRNLGALLGGQLLYITPFFLVAAAFVLADLGRTRSSDPVARLLWFATLVPAVVIIPVCLWSKVAEPHWLAPAYLGLALQVGRRRVVGRILTIGSLATGALATLLVWLWIRTPLPVALLGSSYRPRYDLANDLYAWEPGGVALEESVARAFIETRTLPVVVGPHWIVCAQAHAKLGHRVPVGCNTPIRDDFDRWMPRKRWLNAPVVLYVHDSRFELHPELELPGRVATRTQKVDITRGGKIVRTITITRLEKLLDVGAR